MRTGTILVAPRSPEWVHGDSVIALSIHSLQSALHRAKSEMYSTRQRRAPVLTGTSFVLVVESRAASER